MSSVSLVDGSSERLRLHVGTVRAASTCRRTDTQGVLAVRKTDPAALHQTTKVVAVELLQSLRGVMDILKLKESDEYA